MFRRIINIFVVLSLTFTLFVISPSSSASAGPQRVTKIAINQMRYVSTTGSDTANDCTVISSPCATIIHSVDEAISGDTISIAAGTYIETGSITISKDLQFIGAGVDQSILDGGGTHRVIYNGSTAVSFTDLTIQNGNISDGTGAGGIFNGGDLTLTRVKVTNNTAAAVGGGIITYGNPTITDSTISNNHATGIGESNSGYGGGIFIKGASTIVTINNTTISGNTAAGSGGGIHNQESSTLALTNVTLSDNTAYGGGGMTNTSSSTTTILNSTIANNHLAEGGYAGGIANYATLNIKNTIVAGNDGNQCITSGTWTSQGYNISSDDNCDFTQTGDLDNTDPLLAALADYGGDTLTHALLTGSPAIDTGTNIGCPATDQRGVSRPQGSHCDIGAFEGSVALDPDQVGFYVPSKYRWYFKTDMVDGWSGVISMGWGGASELMPVTGDWDGDGIDTAGFYKPSQYKWLIKNNQTDGWVGVSSFNWGGAADLTPIAGDWDGDGDDTVGFYNEATGEWFLKDDNTGGWSGFTKVIWGGAAGNIPLVGDWNGDGSDTLGFFVPSQNKWWLKDNLVDGWSGVSGFRFGTADPMEPVAGDWDGDGVDTVGAYVPAKWRWYLKDDLVSGWSNVSILKFGPAAAYEVLAGDWQ